MTTRENASWIELATGTNAIATAIAAAPVGGLSHFITSVSGSFGAAVSGATLILSDGGTEVARWHVHNSFSISLPSPIKIDAGNAADLALAASGSAGVDGSAVLTGYTL